MKFTALLKKREAKRLRRELRIQATRRTLVVEGLAQNNLPEIGLQAKLRLCTQDKIYTIEDFSFVSGKELNAVSTDGDVVTLSPTLAAEKVTEERSR